MLFRRNFYVAFLLLFSFGVPAFNGPVGADENAKANEKTDAPKHPSAGELERDDEYYELLQLFADTLDQVDRNYVKDVSRRELMEAAIKGMISKLDQYSNYIPPEDIDRFKGSVESEFGGIGIQVSVEGAYPTVISPIYGSPAYKAGMIAGDKIIKIGDKSAEGITLDEAVKLMKGKVGTKVQVTVRHAVDGKEEQFELERAIVRVQTVLADTRKDNDKWDFILDKENKIGYIRLSAFSRHTAEELKDALDQLKKQKAKALVLDLRFNPGGLLSSAIQISDMFIEEGRIVSTEGRNAPKRVWDAHKRGTYADLPMAVLVNKYSASASEIVSACLKDHERAVVIGERTWGKGSVQNIIELEGGASALKLTTAGYVRPNGKNIHKFDGASEKDDWGVRPSKGFEVKLSPEETTAFLHYRRDRDIIQKKTMGDEPPGIDFEDKQLEKALEYLTKVLADDEQQAAARE